MKMINQEFHLSVGGIGIRVSTELPLTATDGLKKFFTSSSADVTIHIKALEKKHVLKDAELYGEDLHFSYYRDQQYCYSLAKPGVNGSVSTAVYKPDFLECMLYINETAFPHTIRTVDMALQLFPLRHLLFFHQAAVLHSSRVNAGGKALLFSAPSQTGKSTQAGLWKRYVGADIVSNDRSILRQENGNFFTYGYPIDGSSPIFNNERIPLGAVVMLAQGTENCVERLSALRAVSCLIAQTVSNPWDPSGNATGRLWLDLAAAYPVYRLTCRPDKEAVFCLKERLEKDGVI